MTIGILPCAGKAERFGGLPKYLLPCPGGFLLQRHINAMNEAGCLAVGVGANENNIDLINEYASVGACLARHYETMVETVRSVKLYADDNLFIEHSVLFGMPDTYIADEMNPYKDLTDLLEDSNDDLLVGMFRLRSDQYKQGGVVRVEGDKIVDVIDKPTERPERECYIWGLLAWRPSFWQCLEPDMPHVGYGIMKAIEKGLKVSPVKLMGRYYDCGTFERYATMIRDVTCESE